MEQNNHFLCFDYEVYQSLFERNGNILLVVGPKTERILLANASACAFYQYSLAEITKLCFKDLTFNAHSFQFNNLTLKHERFRMKHRLKDQTLVNVEVLIDPIEIENQTVLLMCVTQIEYRQQLRSLLSVVFSQSPDAIALLDHDFNIVAINQKFTQIFGYQEKDIVGGRIEDYIIPQLSKEEIVTNYQLALQGKVCTIETVRKSKQNRLIPVRLTIIPYFVGDEIIGFQVIYQDISNKVKQSEKLRLFKEIIQNDTDSVLITNRTPQIIWVNKAFEKISGYKKEEVLKKNPVFLDSGLNGSDFYKAMWEKINATGEWQGEIWNKKKDGTIFPQWLHIFTIKNWEGNVKNYVGIFKDLGKIDSVNKKILLLLEKDPLTSIYNRTHIMDLLNKGLFTNQTSNYLLFLDINGFKDFNDQNGHRFGDLVLIEFAKRLLSVFGNAHIARYGGDEFIVYFKEDITPFALQAQIKKLINYLKTDIQIEDKSFAIACSIGIAKSPEDGLSSQELIEYADKAMYYAKSNKMDYAFWSDIKSLKLIG